MPTGTYLDGDEEWLRFRELAASFLKDCVATGFLVVDTNLSYDFHEREMRFSIKVGATDEPVVVQSREV